jgi:molecular chaperone DnaJ
MSTNEGVRADWATKDFYQVLGVATDASQADIKKAYRVLARDNHPDSNPGDTAKHDRFKAVAEAYDVVGDPEKRKKYDEVRSAYSSGGFGFPPGGYQPGGAGGFDVSDLFGDRVRGGGLGDMFGDLFGGRRGAGQTRRGQRGPDVETSATIGFTDAIDGVTISLRLTADSPCPDCHGTGGKPGTKPHVCPECEGAGFVVVSTGGAFSMNETCPACGGRQLVYDDPCPTCHGSGRGSSARTVKVRPHRLFGRKDDNLTLDVPISFDEAALGAEVRIPTLSGQPVTLKIPAGTPNGRTFRVRGKGARRKDGTVGDLLATVEVQVPAVLDQHAREAIEAYRSATAGKPLRANLFEDGAG